MMKVIFHKDFYQVYTSDPAAVAGRMEAITDVIEAETTFITAEPASAEDIALAHTQDHIDYVRRKKLYDISALAAGGAVQAAEIGLTEPCFGLIRPPGHHASANSSWGFCYFNNIAIAVASLKRRKKIETAYILDIDLHYGDGTVNILEKEDYVTVSNVDGHNRQLYLNNVAKEMERCKADIIGISAGFDAHKQDWGGLLMTEDYFEIGKMVRESAQRRGKGCFAVLEGGYNHNVLGYNVKALIEGLSLK